MSLLCPYRMLEPLHLQAKAICTLSGEVCLKIGFVYNLTLEIQLLNILILGAVFLCWVAKSLLNEDWGIPVPIL